jgi:hypothetical protein
MKMLEMCHHQSPPLSVASATVCRPAPSRAVAQIMFHCAAVDRAAACWRGY